RLHRQQIVFAHQSRDAFMVDRHSASPQFFAHAPITVAALVFGEDVLNRRTNFHVLFNGLPRLQRPIESGAAHARQLTHPLYTQVALHRHQLPDLLVDAVSPGCVLLWRRASTFCKAPLKKSASSVLSATSRFRCATWSRSSRSFPFSAGASPSS